MPTITPGSLHGVGVSLIGPAFSLPSRQPRREAGSQTPHLATRLSSEALRLFSAWYQMTLRTSMAPVSAFPGAQYPDAFCPCTERPCHFLSHSLTATRTALACGNSFSSSTL